MRKIFATVVISGTLLFTSSFAAFAAITTGPVGRNSTRVYPGPGKGEVTVEWSRFFLDGENFTIHYGTGAGATEFAAPYVGYISTYTLGNLVPGKRYYFSIEGIRAGNVSAGTDGVVSTVAPKAPVTVMGTPGPVGRNVLRAKPGPKKGEVTLKWTRFFPDTELYNIVYGTKPGQYQYGVLDAKDTTPQDNDYDFTVGGLASGKRYYFALAPQRSGQAMYVTSEVSAVAK